MRERDNRSLTGQTMFTNLYCHEKCLEQPGVEWEDRWECMCNDKCPACGKEIEPYESIDDDATEDAGQPA